jgi:hypothetical protein
MNTPQALRSSSHVPFRRKIVAAAVTLLLVAVSWTFVFMISEPPLLLRPPALDGRESRAAVSIRDHEMPLLKWVTRMFVLQHTARHYNEVWYFTEFAGREGDRKAEFQQAVEEALENYEHVDIFILAHSNHYYERVRAIEKDTDRLRLVYNTGCYDISQSNIWQELGADTYVGHPGDSDSHLFYFYFMRRWVRGYEIEEAVAEANTETKHLIYRGPVGDLVVYLLRKDD